MDTAISIHVVGVESKRKSDREISYTMKCIKNHLVGLTSGEHMWYYLYSSDLDEEQLSFCLAISAVLNL